MDSNGFTCRPVCNEECEQNHGYCPEPNVCSCLSGYEKTGNDSSSVTCEPICTPACVNSYCVAPNVCRCTDGYEHKEFDSEEFFICKPKCENTCVHGSCTAPGICTCYNGYRAVSATVCEPICEMGCGNGTCTAPEVCTCDEGFAYNNRRDPMCQPNCEVQCDWSTQEIITDKKKQTWNACKAHNLHSNCTCIEGYRFSDIAIRAIKTYPNIFKNKLPFVIPGMTRVSMHICTKRHIINLK